MRSVMVLSILLVPVMAGCLGADGAPSADDACRSCPADLDPDGDGTVPLGTFTWGEPSRPGAGNQVGERVAAFRVPRDVTQLEVTAVRDHEGVERENARLVLRDHNDHELAAATFESVTFGSGDDRERIVVKGIPRYGVSLSLLYIYATQPDGVRHQLELEVDGHL